MKQAAKLLAAQILLSFPLWAADLTGIWMGQTTGRGGEKQDLAFQFKRNNTTLKGVMFGDEFDLPVEDLALNGDRVTFSVTSTNYYDGRRIKFLFTGTFTDKVLQLTRERAPDGSPTTNRQTPNQTITLHRLT